MLTNELQTADSDQQTRGVSKQINLTQAQQQSPALGMLQFQGDAALAAVDGVEVGGVLHPVIGEPLFGRLPTAPPVEALARLRRLGPS